MLSKNLLFNAKNVVQHDEIYPTLKRVIQRENLLSSAKKGYPTPKRVIHNPTWENFIKREQRVIQHEKKITQCESVILRESFIQRKNVLSNARTCYRTWKPVIKRENLLSNAKTCYPRKNVLSKVKTCHLTRKPVIQREKCYPIRRHSIQR